VRVKNAVQYIGCFADTLTAEARRRGVDGVVCGHIHHAELRTIDGVLYANDGDWVESLTALVEQLDGTLQILDWSQPHADPIEQEPLSVPSLPTHAADVAAHVAA